MIALAAAIVLGLIAVFIANAYLTGREAKTDLAGTTKVAVAAVPLAYGTDITPDKVKFVEYPNASIPPGAFMNAAQLLPEGKKRFALMTIGVNEPVLATKISGAGEGASIAALLTEGMRAATVRIDDVSGVAGFVQPNDSVDVLITRNIPGAAQAQQVTDVLLQNVRVIAIDQEAKNSDGTPKVARTATVEVAPIDAQKLALAQQAGSLSLVLRKPGEVNNPVVETVSMNDLRYNMYGGARYPAPASVGSYGAALTEAISLPKRNPAPRRAASSGAKPKAAPAKPSIEVYRGTQSNEYKVGGYGG
jgi:pilus assembly protein CpaB